MGGRGSSGTARANINRSSSTQDTVQDRTNSASNFNRISGFIGNGAIENKINDELRYNLGFNEEWATVDNIRILSSPEEVQNNGGIAQVEAQYTVRIRVPYTEYDGDGMPYQTFEDEEEYRRSIFNINILEDR